VLELAASELDLEASRELEASELDLEASRELARAASY